MIYLFKKPFILNNGMFYLAELRAERIFCGMDKVAGTSSKGIRVQ